MTHRERLLAALRRDVPDQVPVTWELVFRFAHALTGRVGWKAVVDAHRQIGSAVFNLQGLGPSARCELPEGYAEHIEHATRPDGATLSTRTLATPRGQLVQRSLSGYLPHDPHVGKTVEYLVKDRRDYEVLADYVRQQAPALRFDTAESHEARRYIGDDGLAGFWICDSVYHAAQTRDPAEFLIDLAEAPEVMQPLLEAIDPLKAKELAAFNESAADVLVYDICWASTSLLSPRLVREYVLPRARWAVENKAKGKILGFFTSGKIRAVLPWLVELEPDFIEHLDVLGDCDLAEVKREFGHRVCLVGNYNPVVLARGTVDDARREAKRCLDSAMAGGGFILSTSDEVPADARPDNMKAVVEYVATHGRY
jgi:hypothetical protein